MVRNGDRQVTTEPDEFESDWFDEDDPDDHEYECDCEECRIERAFEDCGRLPDDLGGGCQLAATECCDFECPFRDGFEDEE